MIKKNRKWIVGVLTFCLIWCVSVPVSVYALNPNLLISNAAITFDNGAPYVGASTRNLYYIDLGSSKSGTITISNNDSTFRGTILFSNDDLPRNVAFNYYFISSNYSNYLATTKTFNFTSIRYIYISTNLSFSYTLSNIVDPDPTPTNTPTPTDTPTPTPTDTPTPSPEPTDPIDPPEPSNTPIPTDTPTPMPTGSGGSGIPLHYLVPFDYYMIAIIILLGGLLICQLFKN